MNHNTTRLALLMCILFAWTFTTACGEKKEADQPADSKATVSKSASDAPKKDGAVAAKGLTRDEEQAVRDEFAEEAEQKITADNAEQALNELEKELANDK